MSKIAMQGESARIQLNPIANGRFDGRVEATDENGVAISSALYTNAAEKLIDIPMNDAFIPWTSIAWIVRGKEGDD